MTITTVVKCDLCGTEKPSTLPYVSMVLHLLGNTIEPRNDVQKRDVCTECLEEFRKHLFEFLDKLKIKRSPKY